MSLTSLLKTFRVLTVKHSIKHVSCAFSSKAPPQGVIKRVDPATGEIKTKKTNIIPKITLISGENITITTLQEAEKLSKRRDLKLVKVVDLDAKTQRPVYQLMTGAEYHAEDLKQREKRKLDKQQSLKGEKILLINSRITQHDLETQLRKAIKWLQKMYEVRVVINGANGGGDAAVCGVEIIQKN